MIAPKPERVENHGEIRVLAAVDAAFAEARERAGKWLACHAGCDDCCRRPFAITALDARRLRRGLATLALPLQADMRERATAARRQIAVDFPGDLASGALTPASEWREWFFARHAGLPCPVLDLATGQCRLYEFRPVACRLAGPLIQIGATRTDPCPLCFAGASDAEIAATQVVVALPEFGEPSPEAETLIALAL